MVDLETHSRPPLRPGNDNEAPLPIRWIKVGIGSGLLAGLLYPLLIFVSMPLAVTATAAALLGPAIGLGSIGLREFIRLHEASWKASAAALANVVAGALFSSMALVQLAVRQPGAVGAPTQPYVSGVWLGLDVAWDTYIGLGTLGFALAMIRHPRFGPVYGVSGLGLGALVLGLNLWSFPTPPADAGLVDIGPLVGFWYVVATLKTWHGLGWARQQSGG